MPIIPTLGRLKNHEFEAGLGFIARLCLKNKKKRKKKFKEHFEADKLHEILFEKLYTRTQNCNFIIVKTISKSNFLYMLAILLIVIRLDTLY
jgi:hypothetical protein